MAIQKQPYLFVFVKMLHAFQAVQRDVDVPKGRGENDAEHSYQLAMVAWYLIDRNDLQLDKARVLMYALAHDLPEVYAGDVNPLTATSEAINKKAESERKAAARLQKEFPEMPSLHRAIHAYEQKQDPESRFVYAVDKILPITNVYLQGSSWYKQHGVTRETWMVHTHDKLDRVNFAAFDDGGFMAELLAFVKGEADTLFAE